MNDSPSKSPEPEEQPPLGFFELVKSVGMSFLGVQSNQNRKRDFARGRLSHFIVIGLLLAMVFILTIVGVVQLVLRLAAG